MSRCGEWNGTYNHIANHLIDKKEVPSRKAFSLAKSLIYDYTKEKDVKGSFSDRVMYVRHNFSSFMNYLQKNLNN